MSVYRYKVFELILIMFIWSRYYRFKRETKFQKVRLIFNKSENPSDIDNI